MSKKERYQQAMTWVAQEWEHFTAISAYVEELERELAIKVRMEVVVKFLDLAGGYEDCADDARDAGDARMHERYRAVAAGCYAEADRLKGEVDQLRNGGTVRPEDRND